MSTKTEYRIEWLPDRYLSDGELIELTKYYVKGKCFLFENGLTLLCKTSDPQDIDRCLEDLKFIPDFNVTLLKDGNYAVSPHDIAMVIVTKQELEAQLKALKENIESAKHPGEAFFSQDSNQHMAIGLIGRAKINNDLFSKKQIYSQGA